MSSIDDMLLRLLYVILVGGAIGAEREYFSRSAGFRTMILICLGSFLFTSFSMQFGDASTDRIASNIVTGIGFLGAGVIFQSENRLNGITTAATIWAVAALGMGIAIEADLLVAISTLIILGALLLLTRLENWIEKINQSRTYTIVSDYSDDLFNEYETMFSNHHLIYRRIKKSKNREFITGVWDVRGAEKNHNDFTKQMPHHPSVREFEF